MPPTVRSRAPPTKHWCWDTLTAVLCCAVCAAVASGGAPAGATSWRRSPFQTVLTQSTSLPVGQVYQVHTTVLKHASQHGIKYTTLCCGPADMNRTVLHPEVRHDVPVPVWAWSWCLTPRHAHPQPPSLMLPPRVFASCACASSPCSSPSPSPSLSPFSASASSRPSLCSSAPAYPPPPR